MQCKGMFICSHVTAAVQHRFLKSDTRSCKRCCKSIEMYRLVMLFRIYISMQQA